MVGISIIGSGAVGKRTGLYLAKQGHDVVFYDVRKEAFAGLPRGSKYTLDIGRAFDESEVSIVAVPTPLNARGNGYNYSFIKAVAKTCGKAMRDGDIRRTFILKSTVEPGTTRGVFVPYLEKFSGAEHPQHYDVLYIPEFLTVINKWTDDDRFSVTPDNERLVIGTYNGVLEHYPERHLNNLYKNKPRKIVSYETAEVAKLISNSRLPAAISFTNEIADLLDEINSRRQINPIDVEAAIGIMHDDPRIGKYGSVRAAVDVPNVGKGGYGGPCFKKDPPAFAGWLRRMSGKRAGMIEDTIKVNKEMVRKHGVRE